MYNYTVSQWLLFFYIYCFLGWVWESCYVSLENRKWTNRGFMKGPFLPIYGSGAIIILIATIPFKEHLVVVFFMGMIAATLLEYVTGMAMEAIFKVRYWDYSNEKFNVNGHICLKCSLVWGGFSILMVRVIHVPIEHMVFRIPDYVAQILMLIITCIVAADFTNSFRDAIDLKNLLVQMTKNNEELNRIRKRVDVAVAFAQEDKNQLHKKIEEAIKNAREDRNILMDEIASKRFVKLLNRHPSAASRKFEQALTEFKNKYNIEK